jgi:hypothetical protein
LKAIAIVPGRPGTAGVIDLPEPAAYVRHGVDHKPRQVILHQPLRHIRGQQKPLLTAAFDEVLRHAGMLLTRPDRPRLCDSLAEQHQRGHAAPISALA